jgi:hypothetical protein
MKRTILVFSVFALSFLLVQAGASKLKKKILTFDGFGNIKKE